MTQSTIDFYDRFPFPGQGSAQEKDELSDLSMSLQFLLPPIKLKGARVVDVGCGTGQRLIHCAKMYPKTTFIGIDPSQIAIEEARAATMSASISNIEWRVDSLESFAQSGEVFDLVIATGLIHHLQDPALGMAQLTRLVSPTGILYAWMYHAIGEFERLRKRELARIFCPDFNNADLMAEITQTLSLELPADYYGPGSVKTDPGSKNQPAIVDAFFHPLAQAFRFADSRRLLEAGNLDWYCINGINTVGASYLLNIGDSKGIDAHFALKMDVILTSETMRNTYNNQSLEERLRLIELLIKPTGFTLVAGHHASLPPLSKRIQLAACFLKEPT